MTSNSKLTDPRRAERSSGKEHMNKSTTIERVERGADSVQRPCSASFERARLNDVTVAMMLRQNQTLEDIIGQLATEKELYVKRMMELESIAPRKNVMPDGKMVLWQCPAELVPPMMPNRQQADCAKVIGTMTTEPEANRSAVFAQGVWCCERMDQCKWQCFALHQGLAWGTVPEKYEAITNDWRTWHDRECGGRLIQLLPPNAPDQARLQPSPETGCSAVWSCPWCGCDETWFDRTISYLPDGTEDGMKTRCVKCGRATDDLPNAAGEPRPPGNLKG